MLSTCFSLHFSFFFFTTIVNPSPYSVVCPCFPVSFFGDDLGTTIQLSYNHMVDYPIIVWLNPKKRMLLICPRVARLISGLFFLRLVALDIVLEVAPSDQVFDFVP